MRGLFPLPIGFGPESSSKHDYFNKAISGANLLTISAGHTFDVVEALLGPVIEIDARTEILWPTVKLTDIGEGSVRKTADYVGILGTAHSGAVFMADISGGELGELKGDEHEATQAAVKEHQVDAEPFVIDAQPLLAADEREIVAELEQEGLKMLKWMVGLSLLLARDS